MTEKDQPFVSGFCALLGAPNVGKSTLLNQVLGEKISITSRKPQTTRNRIMGVVNRPGAQIVLVDTPGIHSASGGLNRHMVEVALSAASDVDVIVFMVDAARRDKKSETLVLQSLKRRNAPVILAPNKVDLVKKPDLLPLLDQWSRAYDFRDMVPISALEGDGVDELLDAVQKTLPAGPPYFPEDMVSDAPERFIAAELIREKVFELTHQELPYSTAVTVEDWKETEDPPLVRIHAVIHVERGTQKRMVIGKQGAMIKQIGIRARRDLETMLGVKVHLELFVRVEKNWTKDPRAMRRLGYE
ncbi:MAG: GTPase Era [Deltaproteobacteria bacterium]|nr:GTPase Era [Deltaproteobacteria bacterium]